MKPIFFFRKKTGWGWTIIDAVVGLVIVEMIGFMMATALTAKYTNTMIAQETSQKAIMLTECLEVVQSVRYGYFDQSGTVGWDNFRKAYPTGMYKLSYNAGTNMWNINPITNAVTSLPYGSLTEIFASTGGHNLAKHGEDIQVTSMNHTPANSVAERYVLLNTNGTDLVEATCYLKYDFFTKRVKSDIDASGADAYSSMKTIMTHYY